MILTILNLNDLFVTASNWGEYLNIITNETINCEVDAEHDNWCAFIRINVLTGKSE